jgi:UDP-2-acetamido-3-amino-2,3-dideoxy-glucuronate N-acetyltransferase
MKSTKYSVIKKIKIGEDSRVYDQVNLYGCKIGKNTKVDAFVYMEEGVTIGNNCKIRPFVFIPTGVVIEDDVFIAPNVTFTNDKHPRAHGDWTLLRTRVKKFASIGAGSTINPGVQIGENALIGTGSVVTKDIPDNAIAVGIPAKVVGYRPPPNLQNGHGARTTRTRR